MTIVIIFLKKKKEKLNMLPSRNVIHWLGDIVLHVTSLVAAVSFTGGWVRKQYQFHAASAFILQSASIDHVPKDAHE